MPKTMDKNRQALATLDLVNSLLLLAELLMKHKIPGYHSFHAEAPAMIPTGKIFLFLVSPTHRQYRQCATADDQPSW